MKRKLLSLFMVFMMIFAVSSTMTAVPSMAAESPNVNKITTTGKASVKATPDMAYVTIGVEIKNTTVSKAQAEVTTSVNAILAELKKMGVKDADIKTINYNIYPNYQWVEKDNKQVLTGYTVSHNLEVTIKEIAKSGALLDQIVKAGGNHVSGIRFGLSNQEALYNQALELAVKNAKIKAEAMGKGIGVTAIKPILLQEQSSYYSPYMREAAVAADENSLAKTTVMPGEMEITAEVYMEFSY